MYFKWKKWFAWYPVKLLDGKWTWLKIIERQKYAYVVRHWSHGFMTFIGFCGSTTVKEGYDYRHR